MISGRVSTVTYPSGFVAKYDYNSYGYLADIKDNSSGNTVWTANARNAELQLTQATSGPAAKTLVAHADFDANTGQVQNIRASNDGTDDGSVMNQSYDWDSVGNLTERDDTLNSVTEKMCYDALNRLNNTSTGGATCSSTPHVFEVYSASGNDQRKSDVCTGSGCITYGSSAGAHALTGITGTVNGITNPTLTYDANGNLLTSLGRTFTWTSYNMVSQVTQGTTTLGYTYNPDHQRLKQCIAGCTSPTTTVLYLNDPITGAGSEKSTTGTSVVWRDYIVADGRIVASHINNIGVNSMQYFVNDAMGSTAALTDTSGNTLERDYYDPWGKRRNANGSADTSCALTSATTRGFSGHEMMDSVCMTNMNGRIYDQYLSRFASADTMVSDPGDGQDYNRYSYVDNRPTAYRDPTGHGTVGKTPSPGEPEDGLGSDDSSGSSDSSAGSDDSSSGDQGDDSDSGTETITVTGTRYKETPLTFDHIAPIGFGGRDGGGGLGRLYKPMSAQCQFAKGVQGNYLKGVKGPGTKYVSYNGDFVAGLGFSYSHVYFSDNSTGKFGYYDSLGMGVGANAGFSFTVGFAPNMSPAQLVEAQSINGGLGPVTGQAIMDGDDVKGGGGGGIIPGFGFDLGLSANSSESLNFVFCN
jgi:RHS repeat-associated protein